MANITRIKAKDPEEEPKKAEKPVKVEKSERANKPEKTEKTEKAKKVKTKRKHENYFKAAWHEIRQVRWPDRKSTWQMFLAVVAYAAVFIVVVMLLDALFGWLFGLILG